MMHTDDSKMDLTPQRSTHGGIRRTQSASRMTRTQSSFGMNATFPDKFRTNILSHSRPYNRATEAQNKELARMRIHFYAQILINGHSGFESMLQCRVTTKGERTYSLIYEKVHTLSKIGLKLFLHPYRNHKMQSNTLKAVRIIITQFRYTKGRYLYY